MELYDNEKESKEAIRYCVTEQVKYQVMSNNAMEVSGIG